MTKYYIYNVDTNVVAEEIEGTLDQALSIYQRYDADMYGLTSSPAFGFVGGLK